MREIKTEIMYLKFEKSHISTYPDKNLKYISNLVSPMLTNIMNKSLTPGFFPQLLKVACFITIFKADDPNQLGNYGPISILLVLTYF